MIWLHAEQCVTLVKLRTDLVLDELGWHGYSTISYMVNFSNVTCHSPMGIEHLSPVSYSSIQHKLFLTGKSSSNTIATSRGHLATEHNYGP